jgi:hypothetical protein
MTILTARPYIFNRETLKIELHFEKAEYDALSEEQRRELKSNFLWSGQPHANFCEIGRALALAEGRQD